MVRIVQIVGGATAQEDAYTGPSRELRVDTTKKELRIHDGVTVGGVPLARADMANVNGAAVASVIPEGSLSPSQVANLGSAALYDIGTEENDIPVLGAGGKLATARLDTGTSASQIVQMTAEGKLPAVNASLLTDLPITFASEEEAEAGTGTTQVMSPLRTAQAIVALGRMAYSSSFSGSATAVANTFYRCDASTTLTLPALSGLNGGEVIAVSKDTSAAVSIARSSTDTIANGLTSFTIPTKGDCALFYANKAQGRWQVVYSKLSATPADPYGVSSITSWPGVYTGSNVDETSFPIGHVVAAVLQVTPRPVRNESKTLYTSQYSVDTDGFYDTYNYSGEYTLAGTWRHRGSLNTGTYFTAIFQRTA